MGGDRSYGPDGLKGSLGIVKPQSILHYGENVKDVFNNHVCGAALELEVSLFDIILQRCKLRGHIGNNNAVHT